MEKRTLFLQMLMIVFAAFLFSEETQVTPQLVESQLQKAEKDFAIAKKLFDPWYAGPLLSGGATILEAGKANIQPYIYYIDNYAHYDQHGKSHDVHDLQQVNPVASLQFGVYDKRIDAIFTLQGMYNKQQGHSVMDLMDTSFTLRLGLVPETLYYPAVLIAVKESFPTSKYKNLSPHKQGIDGIGSGSYKTTFFLNFSKIVWWVWSHPSNFRLSTSYTFFSSHVSVDNFNSYGGGYGTHGKAHPGDVFSTDFGYEYSFTKRWVFALDVAYTYSWKTTFSGILGVDAEGNRASVGSPFNDQLSLAPALEYSPTPDLGLIGGVWFSVWGRNSSNFVSGIVTVTYTF